MSYQKRSRCTTRCCRPNRWTRREFVKTTVANITKWPEPVKDAIREALEQTRSGRTGR